MRRMVAALSCATALALSACGGGGGSSANGTAELRISAAADDTGRAPSGVVHTRRVEVRNVGTAPAKTVVVSASPDAQALQLPLSCETATCTQRNDGSVEIGEIAAGATVTLHQQLRIKPGYRGAVTNAWQASSATGSVQWQQALTAYVADVAVTVGEPSGSAANPSYAVTLTNVGPDDALDVRWDLLTQADQIWHVTGCTPGAGATCPTTLGETMTLARVPAGGTVTLAVQVDESGGGRSRGLASRVDAAGDADASNNQAAAAAHTGDHLFMADLEGRHYRLSWGLSGPLRATAAGVDYRAPFFIDNTGGGYIGDYNTVAPAWSRGTLSIMSPVMVLGLDISGVRKPYVAPRKLVTRLSELEGVSFEVLGSKADANGKALAAYAGSARFKDGVLQLCLPDTPMPFEQCPAARLSRFEAAMVGSEIELVSRNQVMRLRAASTSSGPILISSSRDAASGASEFWMALPTAETARFNSYSTVISEATFESASGQSAPVMVSVSYAPDNPNPRLDATPRGLPNAMLGWLNATGKLELCALTAQLLPSAQPGVFQGQLQGDWLPGTFADGQYVKERVCFAGPVLHAQTTDLAVFLGSQGDLMGRWLITSDQ